MRLSEMSSGAGCGVKVPAERLEALLGGLGAPAGSEQWGEDAALLEVTRAGSLVHTVDVITPVHDDPEVWGGVAAQHALSDIYAAGALPTSALALLGVPHDLSLEVQQRALRGACRVLEAAGASLAGGHTWFDKEPRLGFAVVGQVIRQRCSPALGEPGDELRLSKSLGSGVMIANHVATGEAIDAAVELMLASNEDACRRGVDDGVRCSTDVSGFGLIGHAHTIAVQSNVTVVIEADKVPLLEGVVELIAANCVPGGTWRNAEWAQSRVEWAAPIPENVRVALCDSQTSGGLLHAGPATNDAAIGHLEPFCGAHVVVV